MMLKEMNVNTGKGVMPERRTIQKMGRRTREEKLQKKGGERCDRGKLTEGCGGSSCYCYFRTDTMALAGCWFCGWFCCQKSCGERRKTALGEDTI